jgi:hypothetical protein
VIQRNSLLLLLFCGLVVAACAKTVKPSQSTQVADSATAQDSAATPQSLLVVDPKKKVVCRTFTPTGTRFQRRVCLTQADWDEMQQEDREYGEAAQRKGVQTGNPSEPCKPNCGD